MARHPALSFRGALKILGKDEPRWLKALDSLLGGTILSSGLLDPVSELWGWVDQKNEAVRLLREGVGWVTGRITETGGLRRHELVVAAHTTIVLTAFFHAVDDVLGPRVRQAKLTDREKLSVVGGADGQVGVRALIDAPVPAPSATAGFEDAVAELRDWAEVAALTLIEFLSGLIETGTDAQGAATRVAWKAVAHYRSAYLQLQTDVPEFAVWADQTAHAATHHALGRLEKLLTRGPGAVQRDAQQVVARVNAAELDQPVLDVNQDGYGVGAVLPTVDQIFISPHYAVDGRPRSDLEWMLARHFTSADATTRPLVLLGHPGAGKSLLTKVLAARLSGSGYTVVRVPLRAVDANASITEQIDQAVRAQTNKAVEWAQLGAESTDELRVVLLDGLDELLQAGGQDRMDYLHNVAEFQRVEALVHRPVAVVVTSRTIVADRVSVPEHCPVVTISDFDDDQIADWIGRWNDVNAAGPARALPVEVARSQVQIARQPLLLLMLALYFADPEVELRTDLSTAELYRRLLRTYAEREVTKQRGFQRPEARERDVAALLRRLSIAALGMVNRGKQSITEADLTADLTALDEEPASGERVLGEFFFVHTAQATSHGTRRAYEFLHLTFAEYLVASHVVDVLADVAATTARGRGKPTPDDDLLFALLSREPLSVQPPILHFARARFADHDGEALCRTIRLLLADYAHRPPSRWFTTYLSVRRDHIRAAATYSANLVLLHLCAGSLDVAEVWPDDPPGTWNRCVRTWASALDLLSAESVVAQLDYHGGRVRFTSSTRRADGRLDLQIAAGRLLDSPYAALVPLAGLLAIGMNDHLVDRFDDVVGADPESLITVLSTVRPESWPEEVPVLPVLTRYRGVQLELLVSRVWELLCTKAGSWPEGWASALAEWALAQKVSVSPTVIAGAAFRHREVFILVGNTKWRLDETKHLLDLAHRRHSGNDNSTAGRVERALFGNFQPMSMLNRQRGSSASHET